MAKTEEEKNLDKVRKEATKLGVPFKEDDSADTIATLIEDKKSFLKEESTKKEELEEQAQKNLVKSSLVLKDVFGNDVDEKDYFMPGKTTDGKVTYAPSYFNRACGYPVDREDLLEVFNKTFDPKKKILFYKLRDRELYIVIVPLKYSQEIGVQNDSMPGDFHKHAISFIGEGSVNLDTLRMRLKRVAATIKFEEN
jgi:hypothetical protein